MRLKNEKLSTMHKSKLNMIFVSLITLFCFLSASCSTYEPRLNYYEYTDDISIKPGSWKGYSVGLAQGSSGGFIWDGCKEKSEKALRSLIRKAKNKGGNALGDLRWDESGNATPTCVKRWGFFLFFPLLLTPFFITTSVEGNIYQVNKDRVKWESTNSKPTIN
jgi:hypothetical protein